MIIAIGVGVISTSASADGEGNGGGIKCKGKFSCSTTNNTTNKGGKGGEGGTGIGIGIGKGGDGGDAFAKGGNANANAKGGNAKAIQGQGQQQGIFGSGNSENTNRNANKQGQGQLQGQGQSTDNANNSDQSVYIEGDDAARIPVSSATSAALTSSNDTCMGSSSAGVQGMTFGVSLGSTWRDEDCVRRKDARMFYNMGLKDVAVARMCQKADNRAAIEAGGGKCPGSPENVASATATGPTAAKLAPTVDTASSEWTEAEHGSP